MGRDTAPGYSAAQILLTKRAPNPPLESPSPMYQRAEAKPRHKRFNPLTSFVDCEGSEQDGEDTAEIRDCKTSPEKKFPPRLPVEPRSIYPMHNRGAGGGGEVGRGGLATRDGSELGQPVGFACARQHVGEFIGFVLA